MIERGKRQDQNGGAGFTYFGIGGEADFEVNYDTWKRSHRPKAPASATRSTEGSEWAALRFQICGYAFKPFCQRHRFVEPHALEMV